jgi:hypothetical protein
MVNDTVLFSLVVFGMGIWICLWVAEIAQRIYNRCKRRGDTIRSRNARCKCHRK